MCLSLNEVSWIMPLPINGFPHSLTARFWMSSTRPGTFRCASFQIHDLQCIYYKACATEKLLLYKPRNKRLCISHKGKYKILRVVRYVIKNYAWRHVRECWYSSTVLKLFTRWMLLISCTPGNREPGTHCIEIWVGLPEPVWALCRGEKSLGPARNRNRVVQSLA
jgi:hypothetical protein